MCSNHIAATTKNCAMQICVAQFLYTYFSKSLAFPLHQNFIFACSPLTSRCRAQNVHKTPFLALSFFGFFLSISKLPRQHFADMFCCYAFLYTVRMHIPHRGLYVTMPNHCLRNFNGSTALRKHCRVCMTEHMCGCTV